MIMSAFYLLLSIVGLGFLVFIHELGHLIVALRNKMVVEVFSIGFGKPFKTWTVKGVKWQLCYLPFGGYVRIAGMEKKGSLEPHQITDGFYSKSPWARIKVALAGPFVNILFAILAFTAIWMAGGQSKLFQETTNIIGIIDQKSPLLASDVKPGDLLVSLNEKSFQGFQELAMELYLTHGKRTLYGTHIDYLSPEKTPFSYSIPEELKGIASFHDLSVGPASYVIYQGPTYPNLPIAESGIQPGDRLLWVNGQLVFSLTHLQSILGSPSAYLCIKRNGQTLYVSVPKVKISDLKLSHDLKNELDDWRHEADLPIKVSDLLFIPYNMTSSNHIEHPIPYLDASQDARLQKGDEILGIDGSTVHSPSALLSSLQDKRAVVIVQRKADSQPILWTEADNAFINSFNPQDLKKLAEKVMDGPATEGDLILLPSLSLLSYSELPMTPKERSLYEKTIEKAKHAIEKNLSGERRDIQLKDLEASQHRFILGIKPADIDVNYNPSPLVLFKNGFDQTWKVFANLFQGSASPKDLAGPVGIVTALQASWAKSVKDALFWLGFISLNLAFLNLLPIPVLDGGHIVFSLWEWITGKRIKSKTMERLIIPFIILLVLLFIFTTYQDIFRIFQKPY